MNISRHLALALIALGAGCTSRDAEHPARRAAASPPRSVTSAAAIAGCDARPVTGDGVGPIRLGMSLDSVRRVCPIVRDTTVRTDDNLPPERLVSVLMGADTATLVVGRARVWNVLLGGRTFATADSLGVGTTLHRLLNLPRVKGYATAKRLTVVAPAKCGLAFLIDGRFDGIPAGPQDSAVLGRLPQEAQVNLIRVDGCEHDDEEPAADDSTFDVLTDTVFVARDLDGNGRTDYVVRENRPYRRQARRLSYRVAVYLDSIPPDRRPAWASGWDEEFGGEKELGEVDALGAHGSLVMVGGSEADYTSETLLSLRDGRITEEVTHGEDYGNGFLQILHEGGTLVVDASQTHLAVRGKSVEPELACAGGAIAAVRMPWNEATRRFVPQPPRCIMPPRED